MIKRNGSKKIEMDGIQIVNTSIKLALMIGALYLFTHGLFKDIEVEFDDTKDSISLIEGDVKQHEARITRNESDIQKLQD